MTSYIRRFGEAARAVRAAKALEAHESWTPARLSIHKRERVLAIVRDAAKRSPYYRERFAGIELDDDDLELAALPTLDKATMLEHFDEIVTDRRLSLAGVEAHLAELERGALSDPLLLGEYRAMASGGTSGRRGVFVYGREDWTWVLAGLVRWMNSYLGVAPRLPRRRLASVVALTPLHMTARMARSIDVGAQRMLRLDARSPIEELVERLNAHQPEGLVAYASIAALLAAEQLEGRLRIAPRVVATTSEVRTREMEERIGAAWGVRPFDLYASTETGNIAADCEHHAGLHVFEDLVHIEVVDDDYQPVSAGEPGSRLLVTNLVNRTQPLIRFELTDLVTRALKRCACGRPYSLLSAVDGRSDDVLDLPARAGGTVKVHPLTIRSPLAAISALVEYHVVLSDRGIRIDAVIAGNGSEEAALAEIERRVREALVERGAEPPPISAEAVARIPRHPNSGKHRLIEATTGRRSTPRV